MSGMDGRPSSILPSYIHVYPMIYVCMHIHANHLLILSLSACVVTCPGGEW